MAITKTELARRLKLSVQDLVDRDEAARIISAGSKPLSAESLRVRNKLTLPGFYNLAETTRGGEVVYRRDWLSKYKTWRDAKHRGSAPNEQMGWGPQDIPGPEVETVVAQDDKLENGLSAAEQALMEEFYRKSPKVIVRDDEAIPFVAGVTVIEPGDVRLTVVDVSGLSPAEQAMLGELYSKLADAGPTSPDGCEEMVLCVSGKINFTPEIIFGLIQATGRIADRQHLAHSSA